jgi:hypothetical protein
MSEFEITVHNLGNFELTVDGIADLNITPPTQPSFNFEMAAIGPKGDTGIVTVDAPLVYDAIERNLSIETNYYALFHHTHPISDIISLQGTLDGLLTITDAQETYAPINSPTLTGVPRSTTPGQGTATTQIATTAFVDSWFSPKASPTFSGVVTIPTPTQGDDSQKAASTAFVNTALSTSLASYLTTANAASTYQTLAGMSSYLLSATAASTYQLIGDYATNTALTNGLAGKANTVHTHDAAAIISGTIDLARIPIIPSQIQVISTENSIANLTPSEQAQITGAGVLVTTTDGNRWVYSGSGSKTSEASYVRVADITPDWSIITNKPAFGTMSLEDTTYWLSKAGNLSGLADTSTARTNLGLGSIATESATTYYLASNPSGFITSAALSDYLPLAGGTMTGDITYGDVGGFTTSVSASGFYAVDSTLGGGAILGYDTTLASGYIILEKPADGTRIEINANGITFPDSTVQTTAFTGSVGDYLLLAGGTMTGNIIFGDAGQYIGKGTFDTSRGGVYGISLVCSVGYEFNWQAGVLITTEQNSTTPRPLYLDSVAGTTLRAWDITGGDGTEVSHAGVTVTGLQLNPSQFSSIAFDRVIVQDSSDIMTIRGYGLTFPDETSQTTAYTGQNIFDQSLNTTDSVDFGSVEVGTIGGDKVAIGTHVTVLDLSGGGGGGGSPVRAELTKNGLFLSNAGAGITFPDGTVQTTAADGGDFLPLAGGTMTGAILFGIAGQNIDVGSFDNGTGGSNGISLNCAVNYELNWQGGFLENRYSGTAYPIGLNSNLIFGTIGSGTYTEISSNGSVWATGDNSAYGEYTKQRFYIGTTGALNPVWIDASLNMGTSGNPSIQIQPDGASGDAMKIDGFGLTFPDATVQTTAYTGPTNPFDQSLNIGDVVSFGSITLTDASANIILNSVIQFGDGSTQNTAFPPTGGTTLQYIDGTGGLQTFPAGSTATRLETTVFNNSGVTIPAFHLVYINGRHGNDPTIALAQANAEGTSRSTFGFTTTAIADQDLGTVIQVGLLEGVNTNAYAEGALLFLSPTTAGDFTDVQPYSPNHYVNVGTVIRGHPTQGTIQVRITNSNELNELSDVQVNSSVSGDILVKNGSGYWVSNSKLTAGVAVLDSSNTFAANQIISVTDNTNAALRVTQLGTGNAFVVEDSTNPDASPFIINADGNIGIGRQPSTRKLEMTGNFAVTGQSTLSSTAGAVSALLIDSPATTTADCVRITNLGTGNSFVVEDSTNPDSSPFVITAAGDVAIGNTTTSGYKLLVSGQTYISASSSGAIFTANQSNVGGIAVFTNTATATSDAVRITNTGSGNSFVVEDAANPDSSPFVITAAGDVGIGVSTTTSKVEGLGRFYFRDTSTAGGNPVFWVRQQGASTAVALQVTNQGTGASFRVDDEATDTTPFIVDAGGLVGVSNPSPAYTLDVTGTVNATSYRFPDATTQNHAYPFSGVTATSIEGGLLNASAPSSTNPFATEGFTNSAVSAYAASVTPLLPTSDQKDALSGASAPSASNALVTTSAMETYVPQASSTAAGKVELATLAETMAGTDDTRAVTPAGVAGQFVDIQTFGTSTTSGSFTWTKPTGAKIIHVRMIGGGGGGASGTNTITANARAGGGGGGGAASSYFIIPADEMGETVAVNVGNGGNGGVSVGPSIGAGAAGSVGTFSAFGAYRSWYGNGGTGAGGSGFAGSLSNLVSTTTAGSGGAGTTVGGTVGGGNTGGFFIATGGGGGGGALGGVTTSQAGGNGGARTAGIVPASYSPTLAGGVGGTALGVQATAGTNQDTHYAAGTGGGGGFYRTAENGGTGAAGGWPGAGGGGGGACDSTFLSGAGGKGGNGIVIVTTYF